MQDVDCATSIRPMEHVMNEIMDTSMSELNMCSIVELLLNKCTVYKG